MGGAQVTSAEDIGAALDCRSTAARTLLENGREVDELGSADGGATEVAQLRWRRIHVQRGKS